MQKEDETCPLDETFEEFMKRRQSVSLDYINGSPWALIDISTSKDLATFFRLPARPR
jgi:hypothetical protein